MSTTSISPGPDAPLETTVRVDRRSGFRYPVVLRLQYKVIQNGRVERLGFGTTLNVSSRGVLFDANDRLPSRGAIEVLLEWPVLLQGACGLRLIMRGRILRVNHKVVAMLAESREFRTVARLPVQMTAPHK